MDIVTLLFYFVAIVYLYFGMYTLSLNTKARINKVFLTICIVFAFMSITGVFILKSQSSFDAIHWYNFSSIFSYIFPALLLNFAIILTRNGESKVSKLRTLLLYLPPLFIFLAKLYIGSVEILSIQVSNNQLEIIHNIGSPLFWGYYSFVVIYVIASIILNFNWLKRTELIKEKITARILLWTSIITSVFSVLASIIFSTKITLATATSLFGIIYLSGVWYSIIRLKLMNLTSEDASEEILQKVNDMITFVDGEGKILRINNKVNEVLGYQEKELLGKKVDIFIPGKHEFKRNFAIGEAKNSAEEEMNYLAKSKELIPVEVTFSPILDTVGDLLGTVIVAKDIRLTKRLEKEILERKKTEIELIQMNEKLKELDKMKTDFLSVISHELRTPLTSILGFAKIMKKKVSKYISKNEVDNPEFFDLILENLNIIVLEADRLSNLINDVLDISKMEAGKVEWKMQPVSVADIVNRAVVTMSTIFEEKNLKAIIKIEEDLPEVMVDYDRILQVVINLLSNAIKFTDEGEVICSVYKAEDKIIFSVKDSGIGIKKEDIGEIFEKFKQVGDTLTNRPKGTGLGLPICKQIVEHHGGQIWVESEVDFGSNFMFSIPFDNSVTERKRISIEHLTKAISNNFEYDNQLDIKNGGNILVVDDDESIGALLKQVLEGEGYKVRRAFDGVEAINEVRKERPDLIILDVVMPNMSGFDVAAVLKNDPRNKNIPIIMLSIIEDKERGIILGVDRYLKKPVNVDELLFNIGVLLSEELSEKKVLIVDDDMETVKVLLEVLQKKGYGSISYCNEADFLIKSDDFKPDILVINECVAKKFENFHELRFKEIFMNSSIFILGEEDVKC